jgi:chemotaxis protein CheY-P-specific phosphatase CheC
MASDGVSAEVLAEVLNGTLEEAAFVFAEVAEEAPPFEGEVIEARLAYAGSHEGELLLALSADFAASLAANLLGEDEGGAAVTGDDEDAVGELLNMIAGTLATELFGQEAGCKLGLPSVARVAPDAHQQELARAAAVASVVDEEGRRVDLSVALRKGAP